MPWRVCNSVLGRLSGARRGITSVEFALIATVLLPLLLGAAEAGRYMVTQEALRSAAAEAARLVMLRGGANISGGNAPCTGMSGSLSGAATRVPFLQAASLSATMSGCATATSGISSVSVTVSYPFTLQFNYFGATNRPISEVVTAFFY